MLSAPDVQEPIRLRLHLPAPVEHPVVVGEIYPEHVHQQEEEIVQRQLPRDEINLITLQRLLHHQAVAFYGVLPCATLFCWRSGYILLSRRHSTISTCNTE